MLEESGSKVGVDIYKTMRRGVLSSIVCEGGSIPFTKNFMFYVK